MKCPVCNSEARCDSPLFAKFTCGSVFWKVGGEPRGQIKRGDECHSDCGVCGEKLPHHVSHCAGVLKRKLERVR